MGVHKMPDVVVPQAIFYPTIADTAPLLVVNGSQSLRPCTREEGPAVVKDSTEAFIQSVFFFLKREAHIIFGAFPSVRASPECQAFERKTDDVIRTWILIFPFQLLVLGLRCIGFVVLYCARLWRRDRKPRVEHVEKQEQPSGACGKRRSSTGYTKEEKTPATCILEADTRAEQKTLRIGTLPPSVWHPSVSGVICFLHAAARAPVTLCSLPRLSSASTLSPHQAPSEAATQKHTSERQCSPILSQHLLNLRATEEEVVVCAAFRPRRWPLSIALGTVKGLRIWTLDLPMEMPLGDWSQSLQQQEHMSSSKGSLAQQPSLKAHCHRALDSQLFEPSLLLRRGSLHTGATPLQEYKSRGEKTTVHPGSPKSSLRTVSGLPAEGFEGSVTTSRSRQKYGEYRSSYPSSVLSSWTSEFVLAGAGDLALYEGEMSNEPIVALAWSHDGNQLVVVTLSSQVLVFAPSGGKFLTERGSLCSQWKSFLKIDISNLLSSAIFAASNRSVASSALYRFPTNHIIAISFSPTLPYILALSSCSDVILISLASWNYKVWTLPGRRRAQPLPNIEWYPETVSVPGCLLGSEFGLFECALTSEVSLFGAKAAGNEASTDVYFHSLSKSTLSFTSVSLEIPKDMLRPTAHLETTSPEYGTGLSATPRLLSFSLEKTHGTRLAVLFDQCPAVLVYQLCARPLMQTAPYTKLDTVFCHPTGYLSGTPLRIAFSTVPLAPKQSFAQPQCSTNQSVAGTSVKAMTSEKVYQQLLNWNPDVADALKHYVQRWESTSEAFSSPSLASALLSVEWSCPAGGEGGGDHPVKSNPDYSTKSTLATVEHAFYHVDISTSPITSASSFPIN